MRAQRLAEIAKVEREVRSRLRNETYTGTTVPTSSASSSSPGARPGLSSRNAAARAEELRPHG
ncbi:MAG: hypothetical protein U1E52_02100 [Geminicoccaceae bacterium]